MRKIEAPRADFSMYVARPDTQWIEREPNDPLTFIYESGFLPYSGAKGLQGIFYSARSARVVLPDFSPSSENRRVGRKFDGMFTKERAPAHSFNFGETFYDFCLAYFAKRHGPDVMPRERLETIIESGLLTDVVTYRNDKNVAAYVLEVSTGTMAHFWFSFYDLSLVQQSLGLWLMLDCIRDAKERGAAHYYLGTVYGGKALYKTNFSPLEWWDGSGWNQDVARLKELGRAE